MVQGGIAVGVGRLDEADRRAPCGGGQAHLGARLLNHVEGLAVLQIRHLAAHQHAQRRVVDRRELVDRAVGLVVGVGCVGAVIVLVGRQGDDAAVEGVGGRRCALHKRAAVGAAARGVGRAQADGAATDTVDVGGPAAVDTEVAQGNGAAGDPHVGPGNAAQRQGHPVVGARSRVDVGESEGHGAVHAGDPVEHGATLQRQGRPTDRGDGVGVVVVGRVGDGDLFTRAETRAGPGAAVGEHDLVVATCAAHIVDRLVDRVGALELHPEQTAVGHPVGAALFQAADGCAGFRSAGLGGGVDHEVTVGEAVGQQITLASAFLQVDEVDAVVVGGARCQREVGGAIARRIGDVALRDIHCGHAEGFAVVGRLVGEHIAHGVLGGTQVDPGADHVGRVEVGGIGFEPAVLRLGEAVHQFDRGVVHHPHPEGRACGGLDVGEGLAQLAQDDLVTVLEVVLLREGDLVAAFVHGQRATVETVAEGQQVFVLADHDDVVVAPVGADFHHVAVGQSMAHHLDGVVRGVHRLDQVGRDVGALGRHVGLDRDVLRRVDAGAGVDARGHGRGHGGVGFGQGHVDAAAAHALHISVDLGVGVGLHGHATGRLNAEVLSDFGPHITIGLGIGGVVGGRDHPAAGGVHASRRHVLAGGLDPQRAGGVVGRAGDARLVADFCCRVAVGIGIGLGGAHRRQDADVEAIGVSPGGVHAACDHLHLTGAGVVHRVDVDITIDESIDGGVGMGGGFVQLHAETRDAGRLGLRRSKEVVVVLAEVVAGSHQNAA